MVHVLEVPACSGRNFDCTARGIPQQHSPQERQPHEKFVGADLIVVLCSTFVKRLYMKKWGADSSVVGSGRP